MAKQARKLIANNKKSIMITSLKRLLKPASLWQELK